MAITLIDTTSVFSASFAAGTDMTLPEPTGIQDGDILVASIIHRKGTATLDVTGFDSIGTVDEGSFNTGMFYKIASSESGAYTVTTTATIAPGWADVSVFRGVDNVDIFEPDYVEGTHHYTSSGELDPTPKPITTETNGAMVVTTILLRVGADDVTALTVPSGYNTAVTYVGGTTVTVACGTVYKEKATAGVETLGDWAITKDAGADPPSGGLYTISLKPAVADSTAPIIDTPATSNATATTIDGTFNSDDGDAGNTIDAVFTTSSTAPSTTQIKAGQDNAGAAAAFAVADQAGSGSATQTVSASLTLVPGTEYTFHAMETDAAANESNVVSSAAFTLTALTESAIFDGVLPPSDSILYYDGGTHTGLDNATALTTALTLSEDEYINLKAVNIDDSSVAVISGNTAGANSVISGTLVGGDNDWDTDDTYNIVANISSSDVMWCEALVTVSSESVTIDWYIQDVSETPVEYTEVYTQTITGLTGVADGNYTVVLGVDGTLTLTPVSSGGDGGSSVPRRRRRRMIRNLTAA